jgi:exodeoxyribonuclease V alpha subunit
MMRMNISDNHDEPLWAAGFTHHISLWAQERQLSAELCDILKALAQALLQALDQGHVCLPLSVMLLQHPEIQKHHAQVEDLAQALKASGVVQSSGEPLRAPLVLDDQHRLYLSRHHEQEQRLAEAAQALDLKLVIGGPGTGKTTSVAQIIATQLELHPQWRIALAAPTGKAAARLLESVRSQAQQWSADLQLRIPSQAFTLHRLLGIGMPGVRSGRPDQASTFLPYDLLIVDEASMLDLGMAYRLFSAIHPQTQLILMGDPDQLAAVESGAVLSELTQAQAGETHPLEKKIVRLNRSYRFDPRAELGQWAQHIQSGDPQAARAWLTQASLQSVNWIDTTTPESTAQVQRCLQALYQPYVAALQQPSNNPSRLARVFGHARVLCAVREGPVGVAQINKGLSQWFKAQWPQERPTPFPSASAPYQGQPLLILRNDLNLQVFNGDVGLVLKDAQGQYLCYFDEEHPQSGGISLSRLPEHDTAFAMTVHKAQGSEFDHVVVMLPHDTSPILTREWLYTASTRAKKTLTLIGSIQALSVALSQVTQRHSGLRDRLKPST